MTEDHVKSGTLTGKNRRRHRAERGSSTEGSFEITGTVIFDTPGDPGLIVPALKNNGQTDRRQ